MKDWTSHDEFLELQEIGLSKIAEGELDKETFVRLTNKIYELGREESKGSVNRMTINQQVEQTVEALVQQLKAGKITLGDIARKLRKTN